VTKSCSTISNSLHVFCVVCKSVYLHTTQNRLQRYITTLLHQRPLRINGNRAHYKPNQTHGDPYHSHSIQFQYYIQQLTLGFETLWSECRPVKYEWKLLNKMLIYNCNIGKVMQLPEERIKKPPKVAKWIWRKFRYKTVFTLDK
jgi:hypothetical protein